MNTEQTAGLDVPVYALRERCLICGMTANLDPSLHHSRYHHLPEVSRDGARYRFSFKTYSFHRVTGGKEVAS